MASELQELVDEAARLLGAPVTLEDRDFELVAFAAHPGPVDAVRHASILRRRSSARVRTHFESFGIATGSGPVHVPGGGSGRGRILPRLCLPARARDVTYGYLWALEDAGPVDPDRAAAAMRLADRAGAILAQQARARADVARLLDDLLAADAEATERAADELDERGLAARRAPVAVVVVTGGVAPAALWGLPRDVLLLPRPEGLTLLVPAGRDPAPVEVAEHAVRALTPPPASGRVAGPPGAGSPGAGLLGAGRLVAGPVVAGVGEAVADLAAARDSLRHARVAARVARGEPAGGPVRSWAELGVHRLLACGAGTLADALLDPAARALLEAAGPARDGEGDLLGTARCWLDAACSVQRAAAELGVHRQTLYGRLERVEQLTGLRLVSGRPSGRDRTRLHLAVTLAPLLR